MAKEANLSGANKPVTLSQDELSKIYSINAQNQQLKVQNKQLIDQLEAYRKNEFYLILDWNYKVVTTDSSLFSPEFKKQCAQRVEEMLTPKEEPKEDSKEEK